MIIETFHLSLSFFHFQQLSLLFNPLVRDPSVESAISNFSPSLCLCFCPGPGNISMLVLSCNYCLSCRCLSASVLSWYWYLWGTAGPVRFFSVSVGPGLAYGWGSLSWYVCQSVCLWRPCHIIHIYVGLVLVCMSGSLSQSWHSIPGLICHVCCLSVLLCVSVSVSRCVWLYHNGPMGSVWYVCLLSFHLLVGLSCLVTLCISMWVLSWWACLAVCLSVEGGKAH